MTKELLGDPGLPQRFWDKVEVNASTGCWDWTAATVKGHGYFAHEGRMRYAHRVLMSELVETVPDDKVVDHICHNRGCVNPTHLRICTQKQNSENLSGSHGNSATGVRGVSYCKQTGRWIGFVRHNYKKINCGRHDSIEAADAAVRAKRNELFTHNNLDRAA